MSPPSVWISPPVVTLPKGWCTQSTHLPHYAVQSGRKGSPPRVSIIIRTLGERRLREWSSTYAASNDLSSIVDRYFCDFPGKKRTATMGGKKRRGREIELVEIGRRCCTLDSFAPSHRSPLAFFALIKSSCLRAASSTAILARGTPPLLCFRIFLMISPLQTRVLLFPSTFSPLLYSISLSLSFSPTFPLRGSSVPLKPSREPHPQRQPSLASSLPFLNFSVEISPLPL